MEPCWEQPFPGTPPVLPTPSKTSLSRRSTGEQSKEEDQALVHHPTDPSWPEMGEQTWGSCSCLAELPPASPYRLLDDQGLFLCPASSLGMPLRLELQGKSSPGTPNPWYHRNPSTVTQAQKENLFEERCWELVALHLQLCPAS